MDPRPGDGHVRHVADLVAAAAHSGDVSEVLGLDSETIRSLPCWLALAVWGVVPSQYAKAYEGALHNVQVVLECLAGPDAVATSGFEHE